jgi:hypothetical protein
MMNNEVVKKVNKFDLEERKSKILVPCSTFLFPSHYTYTI